MRHANPSSDNSDLIKILFSNIGGSDSEMSSFSLYLYNHWNTQNNPEISKIFFTLSMQELNHLHSFGKLAVSLGADPRLWEKKTRKMQYWSPKFLRYTPKVRQMVSNALYSEYLSIEKYKTQLAKTAGSALEKILTEILREEQVHVQQLKKLLQIL